MEISPTRVGAHAAAGGLVGAGMASMGGLSRSTVAFGLAVGTTASIAQSAVWQSTGSGLMGFGAGVGVGALAGAAVMSAMTSGGMRSGAAGMGLGAGIAGISMLLGTYGVVKVMGPQQP